MHGHVPTVAVPCAMCATTEGREVYRDSVPLIPNEFRLVRCARCGLVRVDPAPTEEALAQYYDAYTEHMTYGGRKVVGEEEAQARADADIADLERWRRPGTLLDIGCGGGHVLRAATRRQWEAFGIEASQPAVEALRAIFGGERIGTPEEPPAGGPRVYDAVVLCHVLEHLPDPAAALRRAREMLSRDGILLCEVPNVNALRTRLRRRPLAGQLHLWHFGARTFGAFLAQCGFAVRELRLSALGTPPDFAGHSLPRRIRFRLEDWVWQLARWDVGTDLRAVATPKA